MVVSLHPSDVTCILQLNRTTPDSLRLETGTTQSTTRQVPRLMHPRLLRNMANLAFCASVAVAGQWFPCIMRACFQPLAQHAMLCVALRTSSTRYTAQESGNKDGIPVVFVHGGPGGGTRE